MKRAHVSFKQMSSDLLRPSRLLPTLATLGALYLIGCGGSGDGPGTPPVAMPISLSVSWPALNAPAAAKPISSPSSASSLVVKVKGAGDGGADFTFTPVISRDPVKLSAYTATYTSANKAHPGTYPVHFDFYSSANGQGSIVASADSSVTLSQSGASVGTVTPSSAITSLFITPVPHLQIGVHYGLTFTARDKTGAIVAVTPGSGTWALTTSTKAISLSPGGTATTLKAGSDSVKLTLGSLTSTTTVTVTSERQITAEATLLNGTTEPLVAIDGAELAIPQGAQDVERQFFRDDVQNQPVGTIDDTFTFQFKDTTDSRIVSYLVPTSGQCPDSTTKTGQAAGMTLGRPTIYRIVEIYKMPKEAAPAGLTSGSTGLTATTTATRTTGTTGTTGGTQFCYGMLVSTATSGLVTPLAPPAQQAPADGVAITGSPTFTFSSAVTDQISFTAGYVVQLSSSPIFDQSATVTSATVTTDSTAAVSYMFPPRNSTDTFIKFIHDSFPKATQIWWRVGCRNQADSPGPQPDGATGLRFIFSKARSFTVPAT